MGSVGLKGLATALLLALSACAPGTTEPGTIPPAPPSGPPPPPPPPPPAAAPVYEYGAKFEPPIGRVVHGMGQWAEYNPKYTALLPAASQPAAQLLFVAIADTVRPWNPGKIGEGIAQMGHLGRIPSIDISLRGNQPTQAELDTMANPLFGVDHEIADGTTWDARLMDLVQVAKNYRKPLMVRIGGEFSGWWNGYHPYDYPRAFRKIVGMFRAAGVENAAFVWCYEPAAPDDFDGKDASGNWKWYPGADVIDWFSIDLFAAGDFSGVTVGHSGVLTAYGKTLKFLDMAVATFKPVVVAESSPQAYDLGGPAQAAWDEWFTPYFHLISVRPEIKWFHYINYDWTKSAYYASSGWKNNDLSVNGALAALYGAELGKPKYLHAGELGLLKDFDKYH